MEKKSIFRPESLEHIENPEQMDDYIRVSRPHAWVIVLALLIAAASVIVWSVVGTLPETMTLNGVTEGNMVRAYESVEGANTNLVGCDVNVTLPDGTSVPGTVIAVSQNPYSEEEIRSGIAYDWIAENVIPSTYAYEILITTDESLTSDLVATVAITTDEVKPIQFILG